MVAAKRSSHTFKSGWKLTTSSLANIPEPHLRILAVAVNYMKENKHHDIWYLENEVMNKFEEEKAMNRLPEMGVHFKWKVIAKQHIHPFAERYCFAIYSYKSLLAAIFEPCSFGGMVVQKESYEPIN